VVANEIVAPFGDQDFHDPVGHGLREVGDHHRRGEATGGQMPSVRRPGALGHVFVGRRQGLKAAAVGANDQTE
jgi:hypothetical protein